jgi:hypothetical protein
MLSIGTLLDDPDGTPFALPLDAATQKFAFLARSGAGKTYAATKLAEAMHAAGIPFVALDPVGVWYGLRLAADGVGPGLPIPVFGGEYGDIPLEPSAGALVADLVVDRGLSLILDVSGFRKGQRREFVTAFAEQLFHRKKTARSPLHLFLEEAQAFVPQKTYRGEERMLGAFEDIGKIGRNYGIGLSLISQRPQAVNKDVLNMAEVLVVMQTNAAHERKAIRNWIDTQGIDAGAAVDDLPNLAIGAAYVWSPQWLHFFGKVRIGAKQTYNASATPTFATAAVVPRPLEEADLAALREAMQPSVGAATGPATTAQRRIAELERQLRARPPIQQDTMPAHDAEQFARLEQTVAQLVGTVTAINAAPARDADHLTRLEQTVAQLVGTVTAINAAPAPDVARLTRLEQTVAQLAGTVTTLSATLRAMQAAPPAANVSPPVVSAKAPAKAPATPPPAPASAPTSSAPAPTPSAAPNVPPLRAGERRVLAVLTRQRSFRVTRAQLASLTGFASSSGTFVSYLGTLKRAGYITEVSGILQMTDLGTKLFGNRTPPPRTTEELLAQWAAALRDGERKMLNALVRVYPAWRSRAWLAQQTGYTLQGSTFGAYLGTLRRNDLSEVSGDHVRASPTLFLNE